MIVRRSLVGTLLCTQALFACYAPDAGEDIATESQATIAFTSSLPILGTWSAGSAVVSRGPGLLDIFWLNDAAQPIWPNTVYYRRYVDGLGWLSTVDLGRPNGWPVDIAATANGGRIDLFVAMQDGKIYHKVSNVSGTNQPTWPINWYQVSGATAKSPSSGDSITVSSWGPGRLDLFWVTPSGNLGHKWAENNTWLGTETGDTPANWFLQPSGGTNAYSPPIESVAPVLGHVDVVLRTASGTLNHHRWYSDQGGWDKTALTCCQRPNGAAFTLSDFVLARRGFGGDFFAYAKNDIGQNQIVMEQLQSEAIGGWFMSGGVVRAWDTTNPFYFGSSSSFHLNEAVLWNNNERLDVIGWSNFPNQNEDPVWRIYFGP